ncbi:Serine carboxypeptidase 1 [Rhynchospora pubera]|uniref:Serine carboxypeptidase 1 n=1 Tax=Rhynchospora pubera TaxID=906938 RepID=A0AAV8FX99_9POAL|nr:Serine carboxypeptidase 1 [Rhynchospora pubera]
MFMHIAGPLSIDLQGYRDGIPSLLYRPNSLTQTSSVIFVDSPVGTGFSYSRTLEGLKSETNDTETVHRLQKFLYTWLQEHPKFKSNPLFIGGDSYGGKITPVLTLEIANAKELYGAPFNLKGYLAGNPVTDSHFDFDYMIPFVHGMALISDELYESTKKSCSGKYAHPSNVNCAKHLDAVNEESGYLLAKLWANNDIVREALGVRKEIDAEWNRCTNLLNYIKNIHSSVPYHLHVTEKGYPALIYSGDHDKNIPYLSTQAWIRSFNFSIRDDWRPWYAGGQVAGFTRRYSNNLTFATVKGAGHAAPEYKLKECRAMIGRWLAGAPL